MDSSDDKVLRKTFYLKNDIKCSVCEESFRREEMLTGRGRLIAGDLTAELRRLYQPSKIYGTLIPLIYPITVCPNCYFAAFKEDYQLLKPDGIEKVKAGESKRKSSIERIFPGINFNQERELIHGAASYLLAVECYTYFDKWVSPTTKQAIASIRAAWLFGDLETEDPTKEEYTSIQNLFYKKALQFYNLSIEKQQRAEESYDGITNFGPDTDSNFGYDGIIYLIGFLTMKMSYLEKDMEQKINKLEMAKRYISKMFGIGKTSKEKPGPLLDMTRDLYDELSAKINELQNTKS